MESTYDLLAMGSVRRKLPIPAHQMAVVMMGNDVAYTLHMAHVCAAFVFWCEIPWVGPAALVVLRGLGCIWGALLCFFRFLYFRDA